MYNYIWQFGVVIVLLAGGYRVLHGGLTLGEMATFIYYVTWLVFPMFDVGQFLVKSRQSAVSINRLLELERVAPMVSEADGAPVVGESLGHLQFSGVGFRFPDSDRWVVKDIDLELEAGKTVASDWDEVAARLQNKLQERDSS